MASRPGPAPERSAADKLAAQREAELTEQKRIVDALTKWATPCQDCGGEVISWPGFHGYPFVMESPPNIKGPLIGRTVTSGGEVFIGHRKASNRSTMGFYPHICHRTTKDTDDVRRTGQTDLDDTGGPH